MQNTNVSLVNGLAKVNTHVNATLSQAGDETEVVNVCGNAVLSLMYFNVRTTLVSVPEFYA